MHAILAAISIVSLLTACGSGDATGSREESTVTAEATAATAPSDRALAQADSATRTTASSAAAPRTLAGRTRELVNPDNSTLVYLYYDVAGLAPPIDEWVEKDMRMHMARPPDKQATREAVRAEYQAAAAAVRGVGLLRLSMTANLSDYDPSYGEFTVRAFAPSSTLNFHAFGRNVSIRFGNGRDAQLWRVDADQARDIRDRLGRHNASADALLAITGAQPSPDGGTLIVDVVEYELRSNSIDRQLIGRVRVAP